MLVKCLYCDADNDATSTGGFCDSCGKKLPAAAMVKPRRTLGGDVPGEADDRSPVPSQRRVVSEALFATGILYLFAGGAFFVLAAPAYAWMAREPAKYGAYGPSVLSWTLLPALAVAVLGVLARWVPLPAVVLALLGAAVWVAVTFVLNTPLAVGWVAVDLVLFVLLGWSLWRGVRPEKKPGG